MSVCVFTIPKPFHGHIEVIQRNAIRSWTKLHRRCEVFLCGDETGTRETAVDLGAVHVPIVEKNAYGTPLVRSAFHQVRKAARSAVLCYANADIILMSDFLRAVERVRFGSYLMLGRRWRLKVDQPLDFDEPNWEDRLRQQVADQGSLDSPRACDYFAFSKGTRFGELPPFAVGRPGWDNWFIFNARKRRLPVIDATRAVMVVHQNHDYLHVPFARGDRWNGPEADQNRLLVGKYRFRVSDSTYLMTPTAIVPALDMKHLLRRWETLPLLMPALSPVVQAGSLLVNRVLRPLRHWWLARSTMAL